VVSALPSALAALGIGVLVLDLESLHRSPDTADLDDAAASALRQAAVLLADAHGVPSLLIGHSAAGPAVLAATISLPDVRAVVTIGSPAPRTRRPPSAPLLVLHAPADRIVPVQEAGRVFAAARHPKSFIALDEVDHAVSEPRHARHVAGLIVAWVEPYLPPRAPAPPPGPTGHVVVSDAGTGRYTQEITTGRHRFSADEPASVGGSDDGPNPYELLLAALGACTAMTLRMYADRKGLPLHRTTIRLRHDRVHAKDCTQTEQNVGMLSRIRREIDIEGPLDDKDRQRLVEIADLCPVHRTLSSEIAFETTEA
jgi:putative redox protein